MSAPLFPLFADLRQRAVLVVGGGAVAERKVEALLHAGALPRVGAPALTDRLGDWARQGRIAHLEGGFDPAWLDGVWLVIAATDDAQVNRAVAAAAETRRLLANVVDDAELSSFQVPALVERSDADSIQRNGLSGPFAEIAFDMTLSALVNGVDNQIVERARLAA